MSTGGEPAQTNHPRERIFLHEKHKLRRSIICCLSLSPLVCPPMMLLHRLSLFNSLGDTLNFDRKSFFSFHAFLDRPLFPTLRRPGYQAYIGKLAMGRPGAAGIRKRALRVATVTGSKGTGTKFAVKHKRRAKKRGEKTLTANTPTSPALPDNGIFVPSTGTVFVRRYEECQIIRG